MQIHHPSLDSGWLKAMEDRLFFFFNHFGSISCTALGLAVVLWKDVDSTQCFKMLEQNSNM